MKGRTYRCSACRNRYDLPPFATVGLKLVCSSECATSVRKPERSSSRSTGARPGKADDVPKEIRGKVVVRDRGRCRRCGVASTSIHHARYRSQGGTHTVDNLIVLCEDCHTLVHSNKRYWQPLVLEAIRLLNEGQTVTLIEVERRWSSS